MRQLNKGEPLPAFTNCMQNNTPTDWEDFSHNYNSVSQESRLHILCEEQESLCGYTELLINELSECHIDHYRKKSQFPQLTFDWNNFIVATMDDDFGARYKDLKYKILVNEYSLIINPILTNAQDFFYYPDYDLGNIFPKPGLSNSDNEMAEKTIEVFNLRHPALKRRRQHIIQMIYDYNDLPSSTIRASLINYGFKSLVEQYTTIV